MAKRIASPPQLIDKQFSSADEIDRAIAKMERRIKDLEAITGAIIYNQPGAREVAESNARNTIREVFGPDSPEFDENKSFSLFEGLAFADMGDGLIVEAYESGRQRLIAIFGGLINRLKEKREDFGGPAPPTQAAYLAYLNLHSRIADVASDLFQDGYHWEAVFAASKALVNYVKERSGRHDLDGTSLMRTVFSRNSPILAFNDLADQTDFDEQEGMMHIFEGVVLGIRNPGGHAFPEGPEQRAIEYLSLISLLAYRVQEAKRKRST